YVKPRVVLFGEPLPRDVLEQAIEESRMADVFIVIGSSLLVYPAAELPYIARSCGAEMVLVNAEPTVADHIFDIRIYGMAGEVLPKIVEVVKNLKR
ncbi:MAG: NAD-dependent protein deacylase, partial [Archaeoglobaceae archaeon]|nr:NAD-dependent protein deacylase [Archaeoglobaceae archaeon]MDW8128883.1 Sir2 family NAD-dependent protein deacetylase [Archaeoglobaceae archaeon]